MVDAQFSTRLEDSIKKSFRSYIAEFKKKAKDERKRYIDLIEKSVKDIIKDEIKSQLPQILPNEVFDFTTPVIQSSTWISKIAKEGKPPLTFDELMSTPINFSTYILHNLKIENLTQEHLVGPAFNQLEGTCKSRVELKFQFEECYKAVTTRLDWTNPERHEYPFDLSKFLLLIKNEGLQVVPANYFVNNNLEYLKGGSLSRKYTTSTTKTKAVKYDTIEGIEDMLPSLWSPVKKLSNLEKDVISDLIVALRMFIRRVVILKRVEDPQLGVKRYQKKLNITRLETFRFFMILLSEMDYLPKTRRSKLDRKRSHIMIKAIDQQRRLIRNPENLLEAENTKKTSGCLYGQYDFVIFCPTPF
uniref:Uncharacterized protein n=1 Tax=Tanacetum cinerariifolium TaxID=118510 RepID=A0A6L2M268_TANCI|nr:hypothetical protein [Tanacetum cinerariifolium]